ncbi:hypothetical protein B0H10DRAFT_1944043 [Mycena sp. CBHHK59/15]|nr:hypothetical protein B0H10DRAFT_1944043 [Mycena sp. CBHHK59/15]
MTWSEDIVTMGKDELLNTDLVEVPEPSQYQSGTETSNWCLEVGATERMPNFAHIKKIWCDLSLNTWSKWYNNPPARIKPTGVRDTRQQTGPYSTSKDASGTPFGVDVSGVHMGIPDARQHGHVQTAPALNTIASVRATRGAVTGILSQIDPSQCGGHSILSQINPSQCGGGGIRQWLLCLPNTVCHQRGRHAMTTPLRLSLGIRGCC